MKREIFLAALFLTSTAYGQPKRDVRETVGFSLNLIGLQNAFDLTWTWKLNQSENPLLSGAHFTIGLSDYLSPSFQRVGGWVEFSPLSILDFRVGVEPAYYFGTFGSVIGFADYNGLYSEDERDRRAGERLAAFAGRAYFSPTFKIKVGHVIFASSAEFELWKAQNPERISGGTFFYEPARDTLIDGNGDFVITASSILLYEFLFPHQRTLLAGFVHDLLSLPNLSGEPDNDNQRQTLGLLAVYSLGDKFLGLHRPQVISKAFYYIKDRPDLEKVDEMGIQIALRFFLNP